MMWDIFPPPWQACLEEAWTAYCCGSIPIGAVVTDAGGRILARGRNRIREQAGESGLLYGQTLAHAEVNALVRLPDQGIIDRHTCILYSTMEPCPLCLGAFYMSGVRELRYAARDPYAGSTNLVGATPYLSRKPVRVYGPGLAELEVVITAVCIEFERVELGGGTNVVLDSWQSCPPLGWQLGELLYRSGDLRRMRSAGLSAQEVFDRLGEML